MCFAVFSDFSWNSETRILPFNFWFFLNASKYGFMDYFGWRRVLWSQVLRDLPHKFDFQEAFQLAETEQKMDVFADAIEDEQTPEIFLQLAEYYAKNKNAQKAGLFYYKAGQYTKVYSTLPVSQRFENCTQFWWI